ncbi:VWA domain-containing protein [Opitutus sp. GAS368]|uniref:vWA domain-containing protein n=1 Tax=Opitutus sp. GAS368 TaxID=1882749 RepID=UPI00087DE2C8|nr:VWA domain-containing protein [Opitutus sp. GAS368]SDR66917.1 von Willebrand factor type A domain-containing protein [Opitutus sp. GAS368]
MSDDHQVAVRTCQRLALGAGVLLAGLAALHGETPKPAVAEEAGAVAYGLIVDNTPAMRSCLNEAMATGRAFVESNGPADEAFVITFSSRDNLTLEQRLTRRKSSLTRALDNMHIQGGPADLLDAVYLAGETLAEYEKDTRTAAQDHALILLTVGANEDSFYHLEQVLTMLHEKRTKVFVIGFPRALKSADGKTEEAAGKLLDRLAGESGGQAYFPASEGETAKAVEAILTGLRARQADRKND